MRKLFGILAVLMGVMLLGTAGQADLFLLEGGALFRQVSTEVIGFFACAKLAMGG